MFRSNLSRLVSLALFSVIGMLGCALSMAGAQSDPQAGADTTARAAMMTSPCHNADGQEVLFGDGHVEWENNPFAGDNHDVVYTTTAPATAPSVASTASADVDPDPYTDTSPAATTQTVDFKWSNDLPERFALFGDICTNSRVSVPADAAAQAALFSDATTAPTTAPSEVTNCLGYSIKNPYATTQPAPGSATPTSLHP